MDILLINPYYSHPLTQASFYRPAPPLGLMYLAGYLRKNNIASKILELGVFDIAEAKMTGRRMRYGFSDEKIASWIKAESPKIVGITCMYSIYYSDIIEIAKTIKAVDENIRVVLGGNHASSYWAQILKNKAIDYVVIGEGEETFLELVRTLAQGGSPEHIRGISFRMNGVPARTKPRPLIPSLDSIPFPAYDMVDYKNYMHSGGNPFVMRLPGAALISSRGCPGRCVYCTVKAVWGNSWRGRSPQNVIDEIDLLKKKYGAREFYFLDDSASLDKKRWEGICDEIIQRRMDIKWTTPNGIAHWTLSKPLLDKMYRAGCYRITFGIESGNVETRKFIGKPYSLDQAKELIQHANWIGMWTICTNIIGFPYEEITSIRDTIAFAKESGTDFACFYLLLPQPTSDVYQYFKKEGLLNFDSYFEDQALSDDSFEKITRVLNESGCDTLHFKKEELSRLQKEAYRSFIAHRVLSYLLNPFKILRKIRSWEDFFYVMRLCRMGFSIYTRTFNPLYKKSSDYFYIQSKKAVNDEED